MKQEPTVLISGASGNMGQAMVSKFLKEGFRVTGLVPPNDKVKINISDPAFTISTVDLGDESALAFEGLPHEGVEASLSHNLRD